MKTFKDLLTELRACDEALVWAGDMTIEEVVEKCDRGDWLLWLATKIDIGLQPLYLAKGHCAKTVYHLIKDERGRKAIDVAIAFGEGRATKEELDTVAIAVYAAATATYAAVYAVAKTAAVYATTTTAAYAKNKNQLETADICRKYIGQLIIDKVKLILSGEL